MLYHIYCDESRQTQDRYMVFGGIIVPEKNIKSFDEAVKLFRTINNMTAEIKWSKVSNQKLDEYRKFVDLFFTFIKGMHFKAIVIDTFQIDHKKFSKGDKELGFYKFFYQFLLHSFGRYADNNSKYIIHFDKRTTNFKLSVLYVILNRGLKKKYVGKITNDIIRSIEVLDSKQSNILQIVDVLIGAIGYQMNGCHTKTNAKKAKVLLSEYIAQKAGLISLTYNTPFSKQNFSIWLFKLQK